MADASPEQMQLGASSEDQRMIARAVSHACMRTLVTLSNQNAPKEEVRRKLKEQWGESRGEYTRLAVTIIRHLEAKGYKIVKDAEASGRAAKTGSRDIGI